MNVCERSVFTGGGTTLERHAGILIKSQPVYEIQYYGKTFRMNAAQVLHDKYMIWCGEQLWSAFVLATVVALVICLITFFVVSWILGVRVNNRAK